MTGPVIDRAAPSKDARPMTDQPSPRHFPTDAAVRHTGEHFLARTLPRAEWTHEAHLATCLWLLAERPDIDCDRELIGRIAAYNTAVGGVNDDTQGVHATITHAYVAGIRAWRAGGERGGLVEAVNALLDSAVGARDWPLAYWSRERLFSVAARRGWVEPDLAPLPARIP